jgi:hypothetical protein
VQAIGIDVWNGSNSQVQNFAHGGGRNITYPLGLNGGSIGSQWGLDRHSFVIVDASGIIRYITPQSTPYFQRYSQHKAEMMAKLNELIMIAGVRDEASRSPATFKLYPNSPNPFREQTMIRFDLSPSAQVQPVRLAVFDLLGREVRTLVHQQLSASSHTAVWDGKDANGRQVPSGIYFYQLESGYQRITKRMVYIP